MFHAYITDAVLAGLTTPALKESFSQAERSRRAISLVINQPEAEDITAAQARREANVAPVVTWQAQAPPLAVIAEVEAEPPTKSPPPRRMKQGLPSGIKANISNPIQRPSVERPTAYERPRPVPPP